MTTSTRPLKGNILGFLVRALLPMTILGAALLGLTEIVAGSSPTEPATLLVRIAGGALLSIAAIAMVVVSARRATSPANLDYGVGRLRDVWRAFTMGVILWLLPATVTFVTLAGLGAPLTFTASPAKTLAVVMLVFAAVLLSEAIPEELVFRSHLMGVLSERLHGWWVILVQATVFTAFALMLRGWTGTADLMLFIGMGVGLGYLRVISGSVWTTVGFHAAFQGGSQLVLTHNVIAFEGSAMAAMIALGAVPFAAGAILASLLAPKYPHLFAQRR